MKASILVYAGANPSWSLTLEDVRELHSRLHDLTGTMGTWDKLPESGYRGIEVHMDPLETLHVYYGYAEVASERELRRFTDINRELESWLFQIALNKVPDDVYNHVLLHEFSRRC